jgi:sortase A
VLGEVFTYEVDKIETVLPEEVSDIEITKGEDYVTLLTCTPYGVNTHRLLVRGHRIANITEETPAQSDESTINVKLVAVCVVAFVLLVLVVLALIYYRRKANKNKNQK